jgi:hypothetical protein
MPITCVVHTVVVLNYKTGGWTRLVETEKNDAATRVISVVLQIILFISQQFATQ